MLATIGTTTHKLNSRRSAALTTRHYGTLAIQLRNAAVYEEDLGAGWWQQWLRCNRSRDPASSSSELVSLVKGCGGTFGTRLQSNPMLVSSSTSARPSLSAEIRSRDFVFAASAGA